MNTPTYEPLYMHEFEFLKIVRNIFLKLIKTEEID